jgi:hypothetical protein
MANADYFPTESNNKMHIFACTTSRATILLENIIKTKDDPENMFPDWETIVDFLVRSFRNPHEQTNIWFTYKKL